MNMLKIGARPHWLRATAACVAAFLLVSGCNGGSIVTLRNMIGDTKYWPPPCHADPCVLTGNGGIANVWERHVDENLALGRGFVVKGVCASACEIAARRAHAKLLPGARLIVHTPTPTVWS